MSTKDLKSDYVLVPRSLLPPSLSRDGASAVLSVQPSPPPSGSAVDEPKPTDVVSPPAAAASAAGADPSLSTDSKKLSVVSPPRPSVDFAALSALLPAGDDKFSSSLLEYLVKSDQFNGLYPPDSAAAKLLSSGSWRFPSDVNSSTKCLYGAAGFALSLSDAFAQDWLSDANQSTGRLVCLNRLQTGNLPARWQRQSNAVKSQRVYGKYMLVPRNGNTAGVPIANTVVTEPNIVHVAVIVDTFGLLSSSAAAGGAAVPVQLQEAITVNSLVGVNPNAIFQSRASAQPWAGSDAINNANCMPNSCSHGSRFHILMHKTHNVNMSMGTAMSQLNNQYPGFGRIQHHSFDLPLDLVSLYASVTNFTTPYMNALYFMMWESNTNTDPYDTFGYYNIMYDWKDVGEQA